MSNGCAFEQIDVCVLAVVPISLWGPCDHHALRVRTFL